MKSTEKQQICDNILLMKQKVNEENSVPKKTVYLSAYRLQIGRAHV